MNMRPYAPRVRRLEPRHAVISARQAQVLDGLIDGLTAGQMASAWYVEEGTVKHHMKRLYRALGAHSGPHAVGLVLTGRVTVMVRDTGGGEGAQLEAGPDGSCGRGRARGMATTPRGTSPDDRPARQ